MSEPKSRFQTTSWSLVVAAAANPTGESAKALSDLCSIYWRPVYTFVRRSGYDQDQAQDLTQGFFAVLLEKHYLRDADQSRGRFRSFLLTAVKHFLANEWDRAHALKRGGAQCPISIDAVEAEAWRQPVAVDRSTPESLFERHWAESLLDQVMIKLSAEFASKGKAELFDRLKIFLTGDSAAANYEALAEELGTTAGALRIAVHRMRRSYRDLLRAEIAETVSTPEEIDGELQFLVSALSQE